MAGDLRGEFLLDPDVVFLNHGSFGACPREVFAVYQQWQLRLERQPVAFLDPLRGYGAWMRQAREALAAEVGADPADLVGVTNATQGLNIVARSLPLAPGDEILTTDHEYAALDKTWAATARRTGARIVRVPVRLPLHSEAAFVEALAAAITPRTRVLFLSHITSPTALLFPIARIVAEARARGIWTVIDGAHAPGHIPLDLDALGADFYAGNCHKWLMAPKGSAFLHVRRPLQRMIDPLVISHGWTETMHAAEEPGQFGNSPFIDSLEMQGTRDPSAFLTVPAALAFRRAHRWEEVAARCRALLDALEARVCRLTGYPPLAAPGFRAPQMAALQVPDCDTARLQRELLARFAVELPCLVWNGRSIVRVSVQGYNSEADLDRLVEGLEALLPAVAVPASGG